uniref:ER membrane protein complex subunit 2 n=1 Tax=Oryzias latipes TaxID=8090 RepID=A0A3P9LM36_ORYLA
MASVSEMYDVGWEEDDVCFVESICRNEKLSSQLVCFVCMILGIWSGGEHVPFVIVLSPLPTSLQTCLQELRKQFPDSHRVKRLAGMRLEALERYEEANKHYDAILQDDPTNTAARKRKIAILKAQGKSTEAIRELNEYLDQLPLLFISSAAFCLEELMMTNPHNHLYCEQYAEVKYTQGGLENMELSRKYFAQALRLNNRNMRALFGLYMSASHIASSPKVSAKVKKDNIKYAAWAATQINRAYKLAGRGTKETKYSVKAVEEMLESMQITMS